jgi:hypothetical protein
MAKNRLIDNGDGTLYDTETHLTWQQDPGDERYTWEQAKTYASKLKLAGGGWGVPSELELRSLLVGLTNSDRELLIDYFDWYWSSTLFQGWSSHAWGVGFSYGDSDYGGVTDNYRVRCVR